MDEGESGPRVGWGVVHAWVGQILLSCNDFKRQFVRPR